jgi:hypothetical protein
MNGKAEKQANSTCEGGPTTPLLRKEGGEDRFGSETDTGI